MASVEAASLRAEGNGAMTQIYAGEVFQST